ncbi:FxsA family protein [Vreelandella olivaria]|uniref:FxsA family protein n=1 Tax=Vreelandella olivaria TaxID=390919 RepID=UPI00201F6DE1|nr:FxsA family protein [Halomonas olivaria]
MPILLFISLFTLLDFVLLFSIGSQIGLLMTLLIVLGTGFAGLYLIQKEGMSTFASARKRIQMGEIPSSELFTGAALIFAGALLLAPGFLSDALGIACLLPTARQLGLKAMTWLGLKTAGNRQYQEAESHHQNSQRNEHSTHHQEGPIEGDFISREESTRQR